MQVQKDSKKKKWQKILYQSQPYEDNYYDSNVFMRSLIINARKKPILLKKIIIDTLSVSMRISLLTIYCVVFIHLQSGSYLPYILTSLSSVFLFLFKKTTEIIPMILLIALLTPILKTLTLSYSSDSLYALAICLTVLHIISHDYNNVLQKKQSLLSLNAGVFSAVLLASRLNSSLDAFSFLFFAFVIVAVVPIILQATYRDWINIHIMLALLLVMTTLILVAPLSTFAAVIYFATIIFISFGIPLGLVFVQRFKHEVQGPWDFDDENEMENI